jgi:hypothetical protein
MTNTSGMHWAWKNSIEALLEAKEVQYQGKQHSRWKGFVFNTKQARIIAIYL